MPWLAIITASIAGYCPRTVPAYGVARELMRLARAKRDRSAETHFAKTAVEIARRSGREIGLDTATRYLDSRKL